MSAASFANIPAATLHAKHMRIELLHTDTEDTQTIQHAFGIVGQQHIAHFGRA